MPKGVQPGIRNVGKFGRYVYRCLDRSAKMHFARAMARAGESSQKKQKVRAAMERYKRAGRQYDKTSTPAKLHGHIISNIIASTALQLSGAKEAIPAKQFPKVVKAARELSRSFMTGDALCADEAMTKIGEISGIQLLGKITNEIKELATILEQALPPEKQTKKN